ncbi:unnamed protein product [Dovyalis caffra]|uniref:ENTH domain-containing protein n=1 Tax=Dovyalis caffra TaxID=77055 RepID=A0AAV1RNY9_9ROSI|nr:unnamed protein product [Dovyalis caffra]
MAAGRSTHQSIRKAIGALKDSTTVGLAKVNSENKGIDVAIVKSTNHDELYSLHFRPQVLDADVAYCIHGLTKRLAKTHNWTVALKTLIVIHRALREVDPTLREKLANYSQGRALMLNLSHFRDDSSPNAWDYSAWVRAYSLYLEEHLECFRILKYDVEKDQSDPAVVGDNGPNKNLPPEITKELDTPELLEQLPIMQLLLFRLLACKPEGAATHNSLIHYALSIVASESVKLYIVITDGILNLVDKYFEMKRHDAIRALEIYKKAQSQGEKLSEFFEFCRDLEFGRGQNFVKIEQPPPSVMTAMEDYVTEAPHVIALQCTASNDDKGAAPRELLAPEAVLLIEHKQDDNVPKRDCSTSSNDPLHCENGLNLTSQATNWELALVAAASSNEAAVADSKLRAYEIGQVASNPLVSACHNQGPFYVFRNPTPTTNVQTAVMSQEQALLVLQQRQQTIVVGHDSSSINPFGIPLDDQK